MTPLDRARLLHDEGKLEKAIAGYKRALARARRDDDAIDQALALNALGTAYGDVGKLADARRAFDEALVLAREEIDEPNELEGAILYNLGNVRDALGERAEALATFGEALRIHEAIGDPGGVRESLDALARVSAASGRARDALEYRERSLRLAEQNVKGWDRAHTEHALGTMSLELNRPETALRHLRAALDLSQERGDARVEVDALQALGETFRRLGRRDEAHRHFMRAIEGYRRRGDRDSESETLYGLARVCEEDARADEALTHYARSLALRRDLGGRLKTLRAQAQLLERLGRHEDAGQSFRNMLAAAREAGDRNAECAALTALAGHLQNRMQLEPALELLEQASRIARELGDPAREAETLQQLAALRADLGLDENASRSAPSLATLERWLIDARDRRDPSMEAEALMRLAEMHFEHGQLAPALQRASEAFEVLRQTADRGRESDYLRFMAQLLRLADQGELAARQYRTALKFARQAHHRAGEADALWGLGAVAWDGGKLDEASAYFDQAMAVYESMRGGIANPDLRASHFGMHQELYRNAIRLAADQGDLPRVFHLAERRAARTFLELLAESRGEIRQGLDDDLHAERRRLLAEAAALERLREERRSGPAKREIRRREMQLEEAFRAHDAAVRRRNPRFATLGTPEICDLATVQRELLDRETVLLTWILDEPQSLLLAVLDNDARSFLLPPAKKIAKMVEAFRRAVTQTHHDPPPHAFDLYRVLLAPAEDLIGARRLLLIPDGSLHLLPFCALLTESTATAPGRLPYLIRRHSITYVPSASVACQLRRERLAREPTWDQQLVAFADPAFTDAAFPRLRGTRQEVARIARLFDNHRDLDAIEAGSLDRFESTRVSLRLGNEASREAVEMRFVSEANPRSSRFVHFATHGLADAVRPQFSWLLFASGTDSTAFWRTFEIFNARIPSELVVLSACETALGRLVQGEGLLGLARAFFYAGALGIFASLWRVSDAATATLIEAFYRHRLQDRREDGNAIGPAEALRRAQLELLDQGSWTAHPYFWAPFVFQGETPRNDLELATAST